MGSHARPEFGGPRSTLPLESKASAGSLEELVLGAAYVQVYSPSIGLLELVRLAKDEAGLLPTLHPACHLTISLPLL